MSLSIQNVEARELDEFVNLSFSLYANSPYWIPPLKKQEKELLTVHPFWKSARKKLFLAYENERPIGRIAAIIDEKYNEYAHLDCGAFGFFECENNPEAAHMLLNSARNWLEERGMAFMRGPLNPSTNYSCGVLVDGFEYSPGIMMPWNPPYYPRLLESWPLYKEQDLFAYHIDRKDLKLPAWLREETQKLKASGRFTCRSSSKKTLKDDARVMLRLYAQSWADNWAFTPLSPEEAEAIVRELTQILDPEFFTLFYHAGKPAAGMVALPNLNPLLKRLNGKAGVLAPWHYLRSKSEISRSCRIMLFGILPEYRFQGLPLLLLDRMLEIAIEHPRIEWVEGSWVLEDNFAIDNLIEDFCGKIRKRYRIYRRDLSPCEI